MREFPVLWSITPRLPEAITPTDAHKEHRIETSKSFRAFMIALHLLILCS
jgi:hypothetical protein